MKYLISLVFGICVGIAYGAFQVRSPAPPLVALVGLLGIVIGEQGIARLRPPPAVRLPVSCEAVPGPAASPRRSDR